MRRVVVAVYAGSNPVSHPNAVGRIGPHRLHKLKKAGSNPATATMNIPLFQRGTFTFASGAISPFKIECDALTEEDWATLAMLIAERVPPFSEVHGVPTGGICLAEALKSYATEGKALVVDDVWTTGGSMTRFIGQTYLDLKGFHRAVVFAHNPVPEGVTALFQLKHPTYKSAYPF
jgi:hypothetical protein